MESRSSDSTSPYDLIFNFDGLLEIDNVILKISDDEKFIYTLKEDYVNTTTFNNLVSEIFDAMTMNKINTDRNVSSEFNFSEFMIQHPSGVEEARTNANLRRPMFGQTTTTANNVPIGTGQYNIVTGGCDQTVCEVTHHTQYIFWINVDEWDTLDNCHTIPGTNC
jgi:hypothetical protein